MTATAKRNRMIFDMPPDVALAIRLAAVKLGVTTTAIVCRAIEARYMTDLIEARKAMKGRGTSANVKVKVKK